LYPNATSAVWICITPGPVSPTCTLSSGFVTTRPATVVVAPALVVEVDAAVTVVVTPPTVAVVVVDVAPGTVVPDVGMVVLAELFGVSLPQPTKPSATAPVRMSETSRRIMQ
jgi:hypothetical protein